MKGKLMKYIFLLILSSSLIHGQEDEALVKKLDYAILRADKNSIKTMMNDSSLEKIVTTYEKEFLQGLKKAKINNDVAQESFKNTDHIKRDEASIIGINLGAMGLGILSMLLYEAFACPGSVYLSECSKSTQYHTYATGIGIYLATVRYGMRRFLFNNPLPYRLPYWLVGLRNDSLERQEIYDLLLKYAQEHNIVVEDDIEKV